MMKLKYLFDNRDLAMMILKNWDFNHDKTEIMNCFRISANAVYPFYVGDQICYLRFAPVEEKASTDVQAELEWLKFLRDNQYPVVDIVPTKSGHEFVLAHTPWGQYISVVFKGVKGKQLGDLAYSEALYVGMGKSLGKLHKISVNFQPTEHQRLDWEKRLDWCEKTLREYEAEKNAFSELNLLKEFFKKLPKTKTNFGLIHYDFELDNVFYDDKSKTYYPIDFDDSVYHWFIMDIEQSIDSIKNELSKEYCEQAVQNFLSGYQSEMDIDDDMFSLMPIFRRYANLFGYTRCLRSLYEKWENEPEWMDELRDNISNSMAEKSKNFGILIEPLIV